MTDDLPTKAARFELLKNKSFAFFYAAAGISKLGTAISQIGLPLALISSGLSASTVGIVMAANVLPSLLFFLVGGAVGDRLPRRNLMLAADILRFCSQGYLAFLLLAGHPPLTMLILLSACLGIGTAFETPAANGLLPELVAKSLLKDANALLSLSSASAIVLGPVIGGLLVGFGGGALAIAIDAMSYGLSAMLLLLVTVPQLAPKVGRDAAEVPKSIFLEIRLGWAEFTRHRWLVFLTGQLAIQNALALALFFVIGPSIFANLQAGPQHWGMVVTGVGIGGVVGGLAVMKLQVKRVLTTIQIAIGFCVLPLILLSMHADYRLLIAGSVVFGFCLATVNTLFMSSLQKSVPAEYMSRVSSIVSLTVMGMTPLGYALSGPAMRYFGVPQILLGGAIMVLLLVILGLSQSALRQFEPAAPSAQRH